MDRIIIRGKEYGLPRELVDKILEDVNTSRKSNAERVREKLNEALDGCEVELRKNGVLYKKNGKYLFKRDDENKELWIRYDVLWYFFRNEMGLKHSEIQKLALDWARDVLNLEGYTAKPIEFGGIHTY